MNVGGKATLVGTAPVYGPDGTVIGTTECMRVKLVLLDVPAHGAERRCLRPTFSKGGGLLGGEPFAGEVAAVPPD